MGGTQIWKTVEEIDKNKISDIRKQVSQIVEHDEIEISEDTISVMGDSLSPDANHKMKKLVFIIDYYPKLINRTNELPIKYCIFQIHRNPENCSWCMINAFRVVCKCGNKVYSDIIGELYQNHVASVKEYNLFVSKPKYTRDWWLDYYKNKIYTISMNTTMMVMNCMYVEKGILIPHLLTDKNAAFENMINSHYLESLSPESSARFDAIKTNYEKTKKEKVDKAALLMNLTRVLS